MALTPSSVAENEPPGTLVGVLSTTDAEGGPELDCFAYNDIQMQLSIPTSKEGFAQVQVPIPPRSELIGLRGYTQFMAPDATANALGLVTSNGMETLIGTAY